MAVDLGHSMKRKLSDWASVAEILSGIAVVITLIVLILGVRDNTRVTRVSVYDNLIEGINQTDINRALDPELSRLIGAFLDEETEGLSDSDKDRITAYISVMFRNYERAYVSRQYDVIGDAEWARFANGICFYAEHAQADEAYARAFNVLTEGFRNYVSSSCLAGHE